MVGPNTSYLSPFPRSTGSTPFNPRLAKGYFNDAGTDWAHACGVDFLQNKYNGLAEYHASGHKVNPYNKGMMSDIAQIISFAPEHAIDPFRVIVRTPMEWGDTIMHVYVDEPESHPWDPLGLPKVDPYLVKEHPEHPEYATFLREPRYITQRLGVHSQLHTLNFDREIAISISHILMDQYATRPEMVKSIIADMLAGPTATQINDTFAAGKEYITGVYRGIIPPEGKTILDTPTATLLPCTWREKTFGEHLIAELAAITDVQFEYPRTIYNPAGRNTCCHSATIILDKHCKYPGFRKLLSETYHPDLISYPIKNILYIDEFPQMDPPMLSLTDTGGVEEEMRPVALVVDDRALGIVPWGQTVSTGTEDNQQSRDIRYFMHYRSLFYFLDFFNRKYIFVHEA